MIVKQKNEILSLIEKCKYVDSEILESETVEFKEYAGIHSLNNSKDLAEEISALSNKSGGIVIIGIKDGSNVKNNNWLSQLAGFELGDVIEIEQRLRGKLKPYLEITAEYHEIEGKYYLAIHAPARRDTLITTTSGKVCIREGRSSRPMAPDEIQVAVSKLRSYDWTANTIEDLDDNCFDAASLESAYSSYCERKNFTDENRPSKGAFLEAIGATSNGCITRSGVLFLGKSNVIQEWLGTFEYRFSWKTRAGKLVINDVWDLNLWDSISRAKAHFKMCNSEHKIEFKGKKYTCSTLDHDAFHEGFMNALVHRDYAIEGMVIVDYDTNKMTITNPGVFYGGVSAKNIGTHQPRHRNKALAKLLMSFQLVDRAGMGVKRMGMGSLIYGRQFPTFAEVMDTVEVTMPAESILPGIFVLTRNDPSKFGVVDLIIFNSLYRNGSASVTEISKRISGVVNDGWAAITDSVERHSQIELCGTKEGVFVRIARSWNSFFDVKKTLRISSTSEKHVKVYDYLLEFGEATNEDITNLLDHKNATHTSQFLRDASYTKRTGSGPRARWSLVQSVSMIASPPPVMKKQCEVENI